MRIFYTYRYASNLKEKKIIRSRNTMYCFYFRWSNSVYVTCAMESAKCCNYCVGRNVTPQGCPCVLFVGCGCWEFGASCNMSHTCIMVFNSGGRQKKWCFLKQPIFYFQTSCAPHAINLIVCRHKNTLGIWNHESSRQQVMYLAYMSRRIILTSVMSLLFLGKELE